MPSIPFVHLGARSEASRGESIARVDELCWEAARDEQGYVGLTDADSLARIPAFVQSAARSGLRPIIGAELSVLPAGESHFRGTTYRLRVLVDSETGWRNLVKLVNEARRHESSHRPPHLPLQIVLGDCRGMLFLLGGTRSEIGRLIVDGALDRIDGALRPFIEAAGVDRVIVELPNPKEMGEELVRSLETIAAHYDLITAAVPTVSCAHPADDAVFRFYSGEGIKSGRSTPKLSSLVRSMAQRRHLASRATVGEAYKDYQGALEATLAIAQHCSRFTLPQANKRFPMHNFSRGVDAESYIWNTAFAHATERYGDLPTRYKERLNHEFRLIVEAGLANAVVSLVRLNEELERDGVQRGPGAGLLTNSVIASLLGLTRLDPLKFDLPFELPAGLGKGAFPLLELSIPANQDTPAVQALERLFEGQIAPVGEWRSWRASACLERAAEVLGKDGKWAAAMARDAGFLAALKEASSQPATWMPAAGAVLESAAVLGWLVQRMEGRIRDVQPKTGVYTFAVDPMTVTLPVRYLPVPEEAGPGLPVTEWTGEELGRLRHGRIAFMRAPLLDLIGEATEQVRQQGDFRYSPQETAADDGPAYRLLREGNTAGIEPLESPSIRARLRKGQPTDLHALIRLLKADETSDDGAPGLDIGTILLCHVAASIKANRPAAFFAAALTQASGDTRRMMLILDDIHTRGIPVAELNVNYSAWHWSVERDALRPGFIAVRGMTESAGREIVAKRREMHFSDLADLCRRTDKSRLRVNHLRALVDAGAFDSLAPARSDARRQLTALFPVLTSRRTNSEPGGDELAFFDRDGSWWIQQYGQNGAESAVGADDPVSLARQQNEAFGLRVNDVHTLEEAAFVRGARVYTPSQLTLKMAGRPMTLSAVCGPAEEAGDALGGVLLDAGGVLIRARGDDAHRLLSAKLDGERVLLTGILKRDPNQWWMDLVSLATIPEAAARASAAGVLRMDLDGAPEAQYKKILSLFRQFPGETSVAMDWLPVRPGRVFRAVAARHVLVCPLVELQLADLLSVEKWSIEPRHGQEEQRTSGLVETSRRISTQTIRKLKSLIGAM